MNDNWKKNDWVCWLTKAGVLQGIVAYADDTDHLLVRRKGERVCTVLLAKSRAFRRLEAATAAFRGR